MARLQVLKETSMRMAVFCDFGPCSPLDTDRHFRGDGGSKHLWNVGQYRPDYTAHIPEDNHLRCVKMLQWIWFGLTLYVKSLFELFELVVNTLQFVAAVNINK
jgi:hypothetical protein